MSLIAFEQMLPAESQWNLLHQQAKALLVSGLLPKTLKTPEQVIVVVLKGRELGIPPMQALEQIHIINGKATQSAELMLCQILSKFPDTKITYEERSATRCKMIVQRRGMDPAPFEWTIGDAKTAQLLGNPSWQKYPRAMLHARTVSEMARSLFPDAISGVSYTPEELGAVVTESGEPIIDVQAETALTAPVLVSKAPEVKLTPQERWSKAVAYAGGFGVDEDDLRSFVGDTLPENFDEETWDMLRSFVQDRKAAYTAQNQEAMKSYE